MPSFDYLPRALSNVAFIFDTGTGSYCNVVPWRAHLTSPVLLTGSWRSQTNGTPWQTQNGLFSFVVRFHSLPSPSPQFSFLIYWKLILFCAVLSYFASAKHLNGSNEKLHAASTHRYSQGDPTNRWGEQSGAGEGELWEITGMNQEWHSSYNKKNEIVTPEALCEWKDNRHVRVLSFYSCECAVSDLFHI